MTYYTPDAQMLAMQREARKRVRDMQERSRRMAERSNIPRPIEIPRLEKEETKPPNEAGSEEREIPLAPPPRHNGSGRGQSQSRDLRGVFDSLMGGKGSFASLGDTLQNAVGSAAAPASRLLETFGIGGEELLILMVMYAVFKDHGDTPLLLALGYLLL